MKRWRFGLLGVIVSILTIYFVVSQIDLHALIDAFAQAHYVYLLPAVLFLFLGLVTRALRWRILLNGGLPLDRAFNIINVAYLANGVLPLRIGELARVYLATRHEPPVPPLKTTSTIIVERLLDLLAVMILLGLALAGGPLPDELRATATFILPIAVIGFLTLVILSRQRRLAHRLLEAVLGKIYPLSIGRLSSWLDQFLDGLMPLTHPGALLAALWWTGVSWGFSVAAGYILMLAFFAQASWVATCLFIATSSLAIALPAVPGNLGPYELSILLALGAVGYGEPSGTAAAFALVVHGVNLGLYAVMGFLGLIREGISVGQLSQHVQEMRHSQMVIQDAGSTEI